MYLKCIGLIYGSASWKLLVKKHPENCWETKCKIYMFYIRQSAAKPKKASKSIRKVQRLIVET